MSTEWNPNELTITNGIAKIQRYEFKIKDIVCFFTPCFGKTTRFDITLIGNTEIRFDFEFFGGDEVGIAKATKDCADAYKKLFEFWVSLDIDRFDSYQNVINEAIKTGYKEEIDNNKQSSTQ